jgi:hypothetical protein
MRKRGTKYMSNSYNMTEEEKERRREKLKELYERDYGTYVEENQNVALQKKRRKKRKSKNQQAPLD